MGVLGDSWCFCKGVGKSERMKAAIFTGKSPAMARISVHNNGTSLSTGFLIHRSLLLTTHVNIPSVAAAESCEIRLHNGVAASLVPHRFFITSSILDITIVGLDTMDGDSNTQQLQHLKICSKPNLDLGSMVYLLGYSEKDELIISEGKVIIATDNLIKLSTDGATWSPGSAGFDPQGNLAFMVCDPMKLATSPNTKSSSTSSSSSSSWKKDIPMQFGIPLPIICDWLNQHWEGSLDELNRPKPQLIRLMSSGQKSEHSSTSFTLRQVFKPVEVNDDGTLSTSPLNIISKTRDPSGPSCSTMTNVIKEETPTSQSCVNHVQGIPTPEIFESPKLIAGPVRRKENVPVQLLDINFPPRATTVITPHASKQPPLNFDDNSVKDLSQQSELREGQSMVREFVDPPDNGEEIASSKSVNGALSEVQSCSSPSPIEVSEIHNGYSSEGETMYSAETAESRNYTTPREEKFQQVRRSQSCVNYNRWGSVQRNPMARRTMLENQRSYMNGRKLYSSQAAASYRSNDYYSPTVSSIMKKRNSSEQVNKPRPIATTNSSPRWMF